jgi:hypothetical protein
MAIVSTALFTVRCERPLLQQMQVALPIVICLLTGKPSPFNFLNLDHDSSMF